MFNNLIESDLHVADLKRRSTFLFATMLLYALLIAAAGVGSIYAYDAHLDNQSLEMTAVVTMLPVNAAQPKDQPERSASSRPRASAIADNTARVPMRTIRQGNVTDMTKVPTEVAVAGNNVPPTLPGAELGSKNIDAGNTGERFGSYSGTGGGIGGTSTNNSGGRSDLVKDTPPAPPKEETKPPKPKTVVSLGVIESKITQKATPPYPEMAKRARVSGAVTVQILLDEQGRVVNARATNGHPLLRAAAERAAYQTRFSPTFLSNQPVKVSGVITFNFVLN
jgi:periplasmic protein TonB